MHRTCKIHQHNNITRWDEPKYIYICIHSRRWRYKTIAIKYMSPQLRLRCAQGWDYIICAGTGMCVHIPFQLNPIASLAWLGKQLPCPMQQEALHLYRWSTHTHTPCRSRVDEMKVTMKWTWQWSDELPNRNTRRGTQKKRGKRRKHQHQHTWPKAGKPWKGKGKEKADGRRAKHQPDAKGPNLTKHRGTHEKGDPWGTS